AARRPDEPARPVRLGGGQGRQGRAADRGGRRLARGQLDGPDRPERRRPRRRRRRAQGGAGRAAEGHRGASAEDSCAGDQARGSPWSGAGGGRGERQRSGRCEKMNFSHFFIDRPIFSAVISIIIVIAGTVAMLNLPIAQFPEITPPQITVSTKYPGANAEVVSQNVAAPIEQQVNGADNMMYMNSTSSSTGDMTLSVYFKIGTDPSLAQVDVQNRVNLALPQLPSAVSAQGVSVQKKSAAFMIVVAVYAPDGRYNSTYVDNFTNIQ